ncbi:MAG: hypothetical protein QOI61_1260 [Actinomycetota bacterium]|jgi:hypothetical protein
MKLVLRRALAPLLVATALALLSAPALASVPTLARVNAPRGGEADVLRSVAFASVGRGWAVGSTGVSLQGTGVDRLLLSWNGTQWQKAPLAAVANSDEWLRGVAAAGPSEAWAVGDQKPYGRRPDLPILLHFNGSAWQTETGAFSTGRLWAVAASGAGDVWALGTGVEHYDGAAWTLVPTPTVVAPAQLRPVAIGATAPNDAWMVGSRFAKSYGGRGQALIEHWNGNAWQLVDLPVTPSDDRLTAVAARSATDVWAVGFSSGAPLTMHWNGAVWTRISAAPTAQNGAFESVTTDAGGAVWAVGHEDGVDSRDYAVWRPIAQRWTGTAWQKVGVPKVGDFDAWLADVSIIGGGVWAVGAHQGTLVARATST